MFVSISTNSSYLVVESAFPDEDLESSNDSDLCVDVDEKRLDSDDVDSIFGGLVDLFRIEDLIGDDLIPIGLGSNVTSSFGDMPSVRTILITRVIKESLVLTLSSKVTKPRSIASSSDILLLLLSIE